MISINGISFYFGSRPIYENASLHITQGEKIGLIGKNGTGKSTLLKILNKEYEPEKGTVEKSKDCSIGYFHQDLLSETENAPIRDIAMQAFGDLIQMEKDIDSLLVDIETNYTDEKIDKLGHLQDRFQTLGGYTMGAKADDILMGLGFEENQLRRSLDTFSGGWRMRVLLGRMLLEEPALLMLDEPTNHLDLPSIEWLENYLTSYSGAIVVVSHDRDFINNVASTIVEVEFSKLNKYPGNYDQFERIKSERMEVQQNAFVNQQKKIKDQEKFIDRFRAKASKAKQVQSRVKALDKVDRIDAPVEDMRHISIDFPVKVNPGKKILDLEIEDKRYGDLEILKDSHLQIRRGDKIAIIGANGKGKSTLLRMIMGSEKFIGKHEKGHNVAIEFYAQHQLEALDVKNDIISEMQQAGLEKTDLEIRTVLGAFLFSGDDIFKKIKVLSGGEKSRVALAKTLLGDSNFLLLDEPTNHLDLDSTNILIDALKRYAGTFLIVSHNRHFISSVADQIWYIEDKQIKVYPGDYQEYVNWHNKEISKEVLKPKKVAPTKNKPDKKEVVIEPIDKEIEKKIQNLETEIQDLENDISNIESKLNSEEVTQDQTKLIALSDNYQTLQKTLEVKTKNWEALVDKI